jgi:hypothetical protein
MSHRKPYPSLGRCIYCLEQFSPGELKEEHIVPFALNGTWIMKGANCEPCRALTSEGYEAQALQTTYLLPRLMLEFQRRKKKTKKTNLPAVYPEYTAHLSNVDHLQRIEMELAQYPPIIHFIDFMDNAPGKLLGIDRKDQSEGVGRIWFRNISELIKYPSIQTQGKKSIRSFSKPAAMAFTIAKIAYCFAVAERGLGSFRGNEIRQLLCGDRDDFFNFVGGSLNREELPSNHLHWMAIRDRGAFLTVIVHLFSSLGAPTYEVVVGPK